MPQWISTLWTTRRKADFFLKDHSLVERILTGMLHAGMQPGERRKSRRKEKQRGTVMYRLYCPLPHTLGCSGYVGRGR